MENIEAYLGDQKPVVVIGGVEYDASEATKEVQALLQDLSVVQNEMNKIKITYDITAIARQSLLGSVSSAIATGESGLVPMPEAEDVAGDVVENTENTENTEGN